MKWESKGRKKKYSIKRLGKSFVYALKGILSATKTEQNLLVDFIGLGINIVLIFVLHLSPLEAAIIILATFFVMALEMVNTAIEYAIDMAMPQIHPLAKVSKDVAAGGVLVAAMGAIVVALIIYVPKIIALWQ